MDDTLFNLKFTGKQLQRLSKKAEKEQHSQTAKVKKCLQENDIERAKIYAENAIRKKNESLNFLRMSARVDAVASRVQSAYLMKSMTRTMTGAVKSLEKATKSMDLEKIQGVMDKFETQFEDLDVHTAVMEGTIGQATATSAPTDQIDLLIKQVADENGLRIMEEVANAPAAASTLPGAPEREKEDALSRRLAALRD